MISIPHTANLEGKTNQKSISAAGVLVKRQHEKVKFYNKFLIILLCTYFKILILIITATIVIIYS
jgi:hypothetical protein